MKNHTRGFSLLPVLVLMIAACGDDATRTGSGSDLAAGIDPRLGIIQILNEPDRLDRVQQLIEALRVYPPDQASTLGDLLRDPKIPIKTLERVLIVSGWSRLDPAAATDFAITRETPGTTRNEEIVETISAWARTDPHAVVQAHDIATLSSSIGSSIFALVEGWFESGQDEEGLEQYISDMGPGDARDVAVGTLVHLRLARDGAEKTKAWAILLNRDGTFKTRAYARLAGELTYIDPNEALAWREEVGDTPLGVGVTDQMIASWASHSPKEAMDWLAEQDPTDIQNHARMRVAFRRFYRQDFWGAMAWIEAKSEDERRMALYQGPVAMYINLQQSYDVTKSIAWTDYLIDESERELTLITIARRWLKKDPDAAEAWLEGSPLSIEAKAEAHGPPVRNGVSQRRRQ